MLVSYLGSLYWMATNIEKVGLWLPVATMTAAILAELLDYKTTEIYISRGGKELNPNLPETPSAKDLYSNRNKILGGFAVALSGIFPPFGVARAADKFYLGLKNAINIARAL